MEEIQLPESLLQSLEGVAGFDRRSFVEAHRQQRQVVSVRLNPSKTSCDSQPHFTQATRVPWSNCGYYLPSRPPFIFDPLLHAGAYYVQEASSMFLEQCLRQGLDISRPLRVLDLCAAPGGKSTLIQSVISAESLLVSNETIRSRVGMLAENLTKWGGANVVVSHNDPRDFSRLPGYFDLIVVDAPCSGSGLFRRDPSAIAQWSDEAVKMCSLRQRRILADAYPALKEGGMLVYSTCSYSVEENEEVCDWLCAGYPLHSLQLSVKPEWNIVESRSAREKACGYRFFPGHLGGEGFFIACFRKSGRQMYSEEIEKIDEAGEPENIRKAGETKEAEKVEKIEKAGEPEKIGDTEKTESVGKMEKAERPGKAGKAEKLKKAKAGMVRKGDHAGKAERTDKRKPVFSRLTPAEAGLVKDWLEQPDRLSLWRWQEAVILFPSSLENDLADVASALNLRKAGVLAGKLLRQEFLPDHELALSQLTAGRILSISLKKEEALQYLRKEEVVMPVPAKGWALVQYEGFNLGWVKLLSNRVNNYYPRDWRILKSGNN